MNAIAQNREEASDRIVPLTISPKPKPKRQLPERFRIISYVNPRTETTSWRVTGFTRDRTRIRENYADQKRAEDRKLELTTEWLAGHTRTELRATSLSPADLRTAEAAVARIGSVEDLLPAVEHWLKHGKAASVKETVRLDDAFDQFKTWLSGPDCELRELSKSNLRRRVNVFVNSVANHLISDVTADTMNAYLSARPISLKSRDNDRRAVSSFFAWCIEKKWTAINPCRKEGRRKKAVGNRGTTPPVLTVDECSKLLRAAEQQEEGRLVPYVAVSLFCGLRPWETRRLTWETVNLRDGEIRLDGSKTKTGRPRVIAISPTLKAWLQRHKDKPFFPSNWRRDFDALKAAAGYGGRDWKTEAKTAKGKKRAAEREKPERKPWPVDVMRHTAISHYFRNTGSYGQTAEQFGNSESIIKDHYQGRVNSKETRAFYRLLPQKGQPTNQRTTTK
jgi:integrase